MGIVLEQLRVVEAKAWEHSKNVEIKFVDIVKGTLRSNSSTSFTIKPTNKHHEFMQKSGFSRYMMETEIRVVELNGSVATLYSHLGIDGKGIGKLIQLEMSEDSFTLWAKENQFLHFIKDGEKVDLYEEEELDWLY